MRINREKCAFAVAVLITAGGFYGVVMRQMSPARQERDRWVDPPRGEYKFFATRPRFFAVDTASPRNPFSVSEGWQPLDAVPLAPPPVPARVRVLPLLSGSLAAADGGLVYETVPPREVDASGAPVVGGAAAGDSGGGS